MSRFHLVWLNQSLTEPFQPLFEIVYACEIFLILSFILLSPFACYAILKATPLHQNVRLLFSTMVVHGFLAAASRLALIAHQLLGETTDDVSQSWLTVASIAREISFGYFMILLLFISAERAVATYAWAWYESQADSTLAVFVVQFCFVVMYSITIAFFSVYEIYSMNTHVLVFAVTLSLGAACFFKLLGHNLRELQKLKGRRHENYGYCISKSYQIRENLVVFKIFRHLAIPCCLMALPAFLFFILYWWIPVDAGWNTTRLVCIAFYDFWLAGYDMMLLITLISADERFQKCLSKFTVFEALFQYLQPTGTPRPQRTTRENESNVYFSLLSKDLRLQHL
ncbi:hypothetical protein PRIPAC_81482 [Pristionchus pacificus]|nr:hypothetical protein PRIPAC_81482 [Pristionchus pacificus]